MNERVIQNISYTMISYHVLCLLYRCVVEVIKWALWATDLLLS